jgi:uroporphyrinogen-III synthase
VILTRPRGQNAALAERLREQGRQVRELPALKLSPVTEVPPDPAAFDAVVFVSGNAVRAYLDRLHAAGLSWAPATAAAVVGPGSAAALHGHAAFDPRARVLQPPADSANFDSEALWPVLAAEGPRKVLIVRGGSGEQGTGRDWLAARLREAGVAVTVHRAYRRDPEVWAEDELAGLARLAASGEPAIWLLTSREGVDAVCAQLRGKGLLPWLARCGLVVTHPRIAEHVASCLTGQMPPGEGVVLMLQICKAKDDAILAAIESLV